mgnify:CR=1 FL=1
MIQKFLSSNEKNRIIHQLNEQFGINNIPDSLKLIKSTNGRIYAFAGNINEKELEELSKIAGIEATGNYIAKQEENIGEIRLTIEGAQLFKEQIKRIFLSSEMKNSLKAG